MENKKLTERFGAKFTALKALATDLSREELIGLAIAAGEQKAMEAEAAKFTADAPKRAVMTTEEWDALDAFLFDGGGPSSVPEAAANVVDAVFERDDERYVFAIRMLVKACVRQDESLRARTHPLVRAQSQVAAVETKKSDPVVVEKPADPGEEVSFGNLEEAKTK